MMESWKNKKILVAEDETANYTYIFEILSETEIQITHAENGKVAVELCANEKFDIIFMDLKMPWMYGFEATKEIRKFNNEIVIIAQSAYTYNRKECIAGGFNDFIPKPFTQNQLIGLLGQYLDRSIFKV